MRPADKCRHNTPANFSKCSAKMLSDRRSVPGGDTDIGRSGTMKIQGLTPILNVSNIVESFEWFNKLGWEKAWDWAHAQGAPVSFGAVCNGKSEIFLCQGGQGSRGGSEPQFTGDNETGGAWMSWWLESPAAVDEAYQLAMKHGMTVTMPPTDEPWSVREFHLRHPDGHTFRVSAGLEEE